MNLRAKDLKSDQEVRWCPGCGDYAILNSLQNALADSGVKREDMVIVSGIGCSSRLPYYVDAFGFHGIHGRAPAIATGVKVADPDLSVWVITGDGDSLSIGGNHLIHAIRRNVDLKIVLFNNRIYGLTKGQYSPTTPLGQKTKTSPYGVVDNPFNPMQLALGAGATFAARTIDTQPKHMRAVLGAAARHKGVAFIEVLQNCVIFNDGAFSELTAKETREINTITIDHEQPMLFGKDKEMGLKVECCEVKVVEPDEATTWRLDVPTAVPAHLMASLGVGDGLPVPIGILRSQDAPIYDRTVNDQIKLLTERKGSRSLEELVYTDDAWTVGG